MLLSNELMTLPACPSLVTAQQYCVGKWMVSAFPLQKEVVCVLNPAQVRKRG